MNKTMQAPAGLLLAALDALDQVRSAALALAMRSRILGFLLKRRARRTEARAVGAVLVALVLTVVAPALALALGPILFGIPHVASEVRYLVVRRRLGAGWAGAVVAGCVAMSGLRLLGQAIHEPLLFARIEVAAGAAWVAAGAALGARRSGAHGRLLALLLGLACAAALAVEHAAVTRLLFVHLHNFGALLLWVIFFRRGGPPWLTLALLLASTALLLSGATVPLTEALGGLSALDVDVARVAQWLTPGLAASAAIPLALLHAFSDSVHYATWLSVIPEEEIRSEGSLTFRMSARSLLADFGPLGVAAVALSLLLLFAASAVNLASTRGLYFSLAGFHGYLELAVVAYLLCAGPSLRGEHAGPAPAHASPLISR